MPVRFLLVQGPARCPGYCDCPFCVKVHRAKKRGLIYALKKLEVQIYPRAQEEAA